MVLKVYYFDGRGICEPIRWILSYGGIDFEDIRAPVNDQPLMLQTIPEDMKKRCRWGQTPLVEFDDGKSLTQSLAICRYFARKCQLIPEDPFEAALCDEYVDALRDYWRAFFDALVGKTLDEFSKTSKIKYLNVFESIVKSNDGIHLVGSRISWADIWVAFVFQHLQLVTGIDIIEGYPCLKNLTEAVVTSPGIKKWLVKSPKTKF